MREREDKRIRNVHHQSMQSSTRSTSFLKSQSTVQQQQIPGATATFRHLVHCRVAQRVVHSFVAAPPSALIELNTILSILTSFSLKNLIDSSKRSLAHISIAINPEKKTEKIDRSTREVEDERIPGAASSAPTPPRPPIIFIQKRRIMGRMKSLQPTEAGIHNLFSVRYRRLVDENNHHNNNNNNNNNINNNNNNHHHHHNNNNNAQVVMQNLIRMKLSQDYIAYCCGQCGHHQRFDIKADELHSIGDALRMSCTSVGTKTPSTDAAAAAATTTTTLVISSAAATTTSQSDAKSINLPAPPVKNGHTTWTRQFHDKSSRQQSKANNIQKSAALVEVPENNLAEMSKCKCSKDAAKTLIKSNGGNSSSSSSSGGDVSKALGIGAALVMPFHSHHPVMMGYKPLLSSIDFSATSAATSAKPSTHNTSCNSSSVGTLSSCSSSRSVSPSSANEGYVPTLPVRTDSLTNLEEEALLKCAPWFQAGIPREISLEILQQEPVGSFLVRESTSKPGCYALSVRVPKECQKPSIAHYLITQTNRGFKIKGFTKEFPSLTSLIVHHSVMQELLPCPLLLHRPSSGLLADYLEQNNFVDIDSSVLLELTRKKGVE